jgi:hypothetical protein
MSNIEIMKTSNGHGGARKGAGKPKGVKWPTTLRKEEARELVRQYVTERLPQFLDAMSDNITGIRHLMMRDPKTGNFERITGDAKQIDKALKSKNAFWIYTKGPNVQAFTDLLNRAIDKPAEHVEIAGAGSRSSVRATKRNPARCWNFLKTREPVMPGG